ncbi:hypothetical protein Tco_0343350 [Tanacetum coccineum]
MIIVGADNRPPILEKSLYDSWKSRVELYIENQENERMILNSLQNGPLVWPTVVEEDGTTRTKKYEELSIAEKLQADCDLKATNIVLQGLPPDVYAIVNHHKVAKEIWDIVKLLMQGTKLPLQEKECLAIPMFNQGDDLIAYLNKAMHFLIAVASSRFPSTNNQLRTFSNPRNQATIQYGRVTVQQVQGRQVQSYVGNSYKGNATSLGGNNTRGHAKVVKCYNCQGEEAGQTLDEEQLAFLADPGIPNGKVAHTTIPNTTAFQTKDLDAYDSDCNDVSNAKAVLMANLFNYGSNVILEITPDAITEGEWGFEHTKAVFLKEIVPFLKTLTDIFNVFYKDFLNEVTKVQTVFNQMKAVDQQYFVDKQCFEINKKELFLEHDRLLHQIMSQDVMICVMNSTAVFDDVNVDMHSSEFCVKCLDLDAELLNKQNAYNDLSKSYSQLEKHCISLELATQLNQEIFQKDSFSDNQNALEFPEYFENNNLKAQLQAKDTTICKLKEHIKSMRENDKEEKVKHEMDETKTINIELEYIVAKLIERLHKEIEHLKKIYKVQFDLIKKTCALSKEHCDS